MMVRSQEGNVQMTEHWLKVAKCSQQETQREESRSPKIVKLEIRSAVHRRTEVRGFGFRSAAGTNVCKHISRSLC